MDSRESSLDRSASNLLNLDEGKIRASYPGTIEEYKSLESPGPADDLEANFADKALPDSGSPGRSLGRSVESQSITSRSGANSKKLSKVSYKAQSPRKIPSNNAAAVAEQIKLDKNQANRTITKSEVNTKPYQPHYVHTGPGAKAQLRTM